MTSSPSIRLGFRVPPGLMLASTPSRCASFFPSCSRLTKASFDWVPRCGLWVLPGLINTSSSSGASNEISSAEFQGDRISRQASFNVSDLLEKHKDWVRTGSVGQSPEVTCDACGRTHSAWDVLQRACSAVSTSQQVAMPNDAVKLAVQSASGTYFHVELRLCIYTGQKLYA